MKGFTCRVLLLSFLLLLVNPCVSERVNEENSLDLVERNDDGGNHKDNTPTENQQKLIKHKQGGIDLNDQQKDGQSARFEQTNPLFLE